MHIIMGKENADAFQDKYTVLELDTFRIQPAGEIVTAYAVVEQIPIHDIPKIENMKNMHQHVIEQYRKKNWDFCEQSLEHLIGFWGRELDSFYTVLLQRIAKYKDNDPGDEWNGIVEKTAIAG